MSVVCSTLPELRQRKRASKLDGHGGAQQLVSSPCPRRGNCRRKVASIPSCIEALIVLLDLPNAGHSALMVTVLVRMAGRHRGDRASGLHSGVQMCGCMVISAAL